MGCLRHTTASLAISAGANVKVVQRMTEAEQLVGVKARRLARGNVDVTQEVDKAKKVTGAEFDEIG